MQKVAPNYMPPPSSGPCPSIEEMAAYLDGNVDETEQKRILDHLASCEDCFFLYSETAHFVADTSPGDEVYNEKIAPFSSRRGLIAKWGAIAALLLVGVGSGAYFQFLRPLPALPTGDTTASIPGQTGSQNLWFGPRFRGSGEDEEIQIDQASFRLGVQLVNLHVSLNARNLENASDAIAFILGLLKSGYATADLQEDYTKLKATLLEGKRTPADALSAASALAEQVRDAYDTTSLDLGQWVETARLACLAQNPAFFQQSASRSFLRRLLWRDRAGLEDFKLDPPTRASLEAISRILGKGDLKAPDYAEIRRQTEKILEIHYPQI